MTSTYQYSVDTGVINADTSDVLSDVQAEWQAALGTSLNLASSTPQGTMITSEVIARQGVMKNNAEVANQINPNISTGNFLSAVCALLGIDRGIDSYTVGSNILMSGSSGATIPAGSRVQTQAGAIFAVVSTVTIGTSGTVLAKIQSAAYGSIALATGSLIIVDGSIGWGSAAVTSQSTVVAGTLALSDSKMKNVRGKRLATQGRGSVEAIQAAALKVSGVTSVKVIENNTGATGAVNGVTFSLPNAVWVCVAGSFSKADLAMALWLSHQGGCPWDYGTNSGTAVDSPSGTLVNDPATGLGYKVKYTTPVMYDTYIKVTVAQGSSSADATVATQNAILAYAAGEQDGEPGFVVGASVSAFEISGAISRVLPGLYVKSVQVACVVAGAAAPTSYSYEFVMNPFWQAQIVAGNIVVTVV